MRKRMAWIALALALALLAGCAQKAPQPEPEAPKPQTVEPSPAPEPEHYERPAVENNGGTFVGVGEQVWFRYYDEGAIDESQLWGEFLSALPGHPVSSTLCYYDREGDAVLEALPDDGFGPLWFGENGFYLTRGVYGGGTLTGSEAYFKSLDGAETALGKGSVAGVSDDGRFAAVQSGNAFTVFEGTEKRRVLDETADFCEFCALTDDGLLVYYAFDYDTYEARLMCLDADGNSVRLGLLPEPSEEADCGAPEAEQCLLDGDEVWCTFGYYEGTGHFLGAVQCVRAKVGAADSLKTVETAVDADFPYVPRLYKDAGGKVQQAEFAPGDVALSEGAWGDLIVFGEGGDADTVVESFLPGVSDEGENGCIIQSMESLGDAVYLTVARAYHDPDNDVGWRMAYLPDEIYYLRAPYGGEAAETLFGPAWTGSLPDARELWYAYDGTWVLKAAEVEGDRSDKLPEGMFEYIEFDADAQTAYIDSTYEELTYTNTFDHAEVVPTNGVDEGAAPFGLLLTGGKNDDMMYVFFEGETLVGTVMHNGGGDSFSRTGYYVRSFG